MGYRVVKPFSSINRRFAVGDPITAADIDPGTALGFSEWVARGFVVADAPPPVAASVPKTGRGPHPAIIE